MSDFKFSQDYVVYKVKKEGIYPIKENDWARLKRQIHGIIPNKRIFQIMSSISFGIFGSAIFALVALESEKDVTYWVKPFTWAVFSVTLIAGIGLLILDRLQKDMITYSSSDVLTEMNDIEKSFDKTDEENEA